VKEKGKSVKTASWAGLVLDAKKILVKPPAAHGTDFTLLATSGTV